jgi:hypothetical protein
MGAYHTINRLEQIGVVGHAHIKTVIADVLL